MKKIVVKDIKIVPVEMNVYDWDFVNNDLDVIKGDEQLKNSIITKVSTIQDEIDTEVYLGQGSDLYKYLKVKKTDHVLLLIEETISSLCKEYEEVRTASVDCKEVNNVLKFNITLLKKDGKELIINDFTI